MHISTAAPVVRRPAISTPELATIELDAHGVIQDCSATCEQVLGYARTELLGRHVSLLVPTLEGIELLKQNQINPRLAYLCHCAIPFRARRRDGNSISTQLFLNRLNGAKASLRMIIRRLEDRDSWV